MTHRKFYGVGLLIAALSFLLIIGAVAAQEATATPAPAQPVAATTSPASTAAVTPAATATVQWTYSGAAGPSYWGTLSSDFATCKSGKAQSPIDIISPDAETLPALQIAYEPSALTLLNNGHTIQLNYDPGSSITVDSTIYRLESIYFHHPSEHRINGVIYPMEMQLVHVDTNGDLAIVSVLIQEGSQDNPNFVAIFNSLPTSAGEPMTIANTQINVNDMVPSSRFYYRYSGSLTTPPCTEGVKWLVLGTPVALSLQQIAKFTHLFPSNARSVQRLNKRVVALGAG